MAYTSGLLKHRVTILNRTEAQQGRFGLDSSGVEFESAGTVWASVDWAKGKGAMNAGALRSEEHTSELQSRQDISYAVFCLKKVRHGCVRRDLTRI